MKYELQQRIPYGNWLEKYSITGHRKLQSYNKVSNNILLKQTRIKYNRIFCKFNKHSKTNRIQFHHAMHIPLQSNNAL